MIDRRKIVFVGDTNVGKTCIINRFIGNGFVEDETNTIGANKIERDVENQYGQLIVLDIWDTAGQERFKSLIPLYTRDSKFAFICFSVEGFKSDNYTNANNIYKWADEVRKQSQTCILYLVATKVDLLSEDDKKEFQNFLDQKIGDVFSQVFMTSSKSNIGIKDLFQTAADEIINNEKVDQEGVDLAGKDPEANINSDNKCC